VRGATPVILAAAALLLALDIVGAVTERPLGFPYPTLSVVSFLVYLAVGLLAAWRSNFAAGVVSAALVGFLDATLGSLVAWLIGHGPLGQTVTEPRVFAYGIAMVAATAAAAGLVGATMASWLERRRGGRPVLGSKS
jgi:energy-converting hydrogenase Eha subunit A